MSFSTTNDGGFVNVNSAGFSGPQDLQVQYVVNSVFLGNAPNELLITLPTAATAFGLDFGSFATTTASFSLSNRFSTDVPVTAGFGETQFLGFESTTPFNTIELTVPNGEAYVVEAYVVEAYVVEDFVTAAAVPEPATWAMMLVGFGGLGATLRSRRRSAIAQA